MMSPAQAAQAALNNFCADTLSQLASAVRAAALASEFDAVQGLALHSLFLGLSQSIGHGLISTSRVQAMQVQWRPVLHAIINHPSAAPIDQLNDLIEQRLHLLA